MTRENFKKLCESGPVLLDGATGSNLMLAGMPRGVCAETWILEHPAVLQDLQRAYAEAGSQIVYAPTFTANGLYLEQHGLGDRVEELNHKLVQLSREAVGEKAFVAGDMTTMGRPDVPYEQMLEIYTRQAKALWDSGVDLFVIETMMGLEETMAALESCRSVCDLPVLCSFSVTSDGMLYFGGSIFDAASQLAGFGADSVGLNCSTGPDQLEAVVRTLAETLEVPILVKPNAGMPTIDENGVAQYHMDAESFGKHMQKLHAAGANLLGGCCGTTPDDIRAVKCAVSA